MLEWNMEMDSSGFRKVAKRKAGVTAREKKIVVTLEIYSIWPVALKRPTGTSFNEITFLIGYLHSACFEHLLFMDAKCVYSVASSILTTILCMHFFFLHTQIDVGT